MKKAFGKKTRGMKGAARSMLRRKGSVKAMKDVADNSMMFG
jgi:hypothetical protein